MKELLTGKCQNDFIYWYIGDYITKQEFDFSILINNKVLFNELPFSMQYGVYLEFFDSVGIQIECDKNFNIETGLYTDDYCWFVDLEYLRQKNGHISKNGFCDTRQEAQQQAIIKANTIYNERH